MKAKIQKLKTSPKAMKGGAGNNKHCDKVSILNAAESSSVAYIYLRKIKKYT